MGRQQRFGINPTPTGKRGIANGTTRTTTPRAAPHTRAVQHTVHHFDSEMALEWERLAGTVTAHGNDKGDSVVADSRDIRTCLP